MQQDNEALSRLLLLVGVVPAQRNEIIHSISDLNELTLDSRQTNSHTIFLAIDGSKTSGHLFLEDAAKANCQLALVETKHQKEDGHVERKSFGPESSIVCVLVYQLSVKAADIAYCFYQGGYANKQAPAFPKITAITGTNGKTSVASLLAQLSSLCHQKSASIGTLGVNIFKEGQQTKYSETANTTPDTVALIGILSHLHQHACTHVALEASSHGLDQGRLQKLPIECAVFTNLTLDHLDYHHTMAAYGQAKRKLLNSQGLHKIVLNADDAESSNWLAALNKQQQVYWYSMHKLKKGFSGCWASHVRYTTSGIHFCLHTNFSNVHQSEEVSVGLIGAFNVSNILAALTALLAQGFVLSTVTLALKALTAVPGRMELFESSKASLLVDYAHTPDALKQALIAARVHTKGKLSCIFGCGGDRDNSKRAIMGEVAVRYADNIVLTQDNSRSEEAMQIISDIKQGMSSLSPKQNVNVELDREKAIIKTWENSLKEDIILVAGKGHETYIEINNARIDYDERQIVAKLVSRSVATNKESYGKGGDQ